MKKKYKILLILIALILVYATIIIGGTYAFLQLQATSEEAMGGTAGCGMVNYNGTNVIDANINTSLNYTGGVHSVITLYKNAGAGYGEATIYLHNNISESDIPFDNSNIASAAFKYIVLSGTTVISSGKVTKNTEDQPIATVTLTTTSKNYDVYLWVNSDLSMGEYNNKHYSGYLYATASCDNTTTPAQVEPGDYINYTPSSSSYTTDTSMTGYNSTETIDPSELNLWRVLNVNNDGTVDIISEYASSTDITFSGETGYRNFVGYLNVLASQYENPTYTVGSRYFGYNGQTEYITESAAPSATYFSTTPPWTCSTGGSCNPDETKGGGDTLYQSDYNLVNTVLGTRVANKVGTSTAEPYWLASRYYTYNSTTYYLCFSRYVYKLVSNSNSYLYSYSNGSLNTHSFSNALRPIVTLKANLIYTGEGTQANPRTINATVYTANTSATVTIGNSIPNTINTYSTPDLAMAALSPPHPLFLKHELVNNNVNKSYVGFVVTPAMASANPGMTSGTYTLRGGVNETVGARPTYIDNINVLKQAFGENSGYCSDFNSTSYVSCGVSGLDTDAYTDGSVSASDQSVYCYVENDGTSRFVN